MFSWLSSKRLVIFCLLLVFFLIVFGCGRTKLTRAKAKKMIIEYEKFPVEIWENLPCRRDVTFSAGRDPLSNGRVYEVIRVKLCEKKFVKIIGIKYLDEYLPKKCAEVQYQWKYANFTSWGILWKEISTKGINLGKGWEKISGHNYYNDLDDKEKYNEAIIFCLYDNDWKVEEN